MDGHYLAWSSEAVLRQPNWQLLENCRLCPRSCGINRAGQSGQKATRGYCRQGSTMKVAYVGPHMGEEPPITGRRGAGTVFLTGCTLRCSYCQNYQISHQGLGQQFTPDRLIVKIAAMIDSYGVHNVSFVTPDHFFPHVFETVEGLRARGYGLPVVMNVSGYQSVEMLKRAENYTDIYLPDFKYADSGLANRLSSCPDYPEVALSALDEMLKQKGFLKTTNANPGVATKGVLVRHLILPGHVKNSCDALTMLFVEFGPKLPLSLMSQYYPVRPQKFPELNRTIKKEEFEMVLSHAKDLGFHTLFVQYLSNNITVTNEKPSFVPDFSSPRPFG
ncbi:MAG: radical SAM protein [Deltaproteobacteria bacterium]|nr:radical SAM protein [Deltaproteobacteria bacterium]